MPSGTEGPLEVVTAAYGPSPLLAATLRSLQQNMPHTVRLTVLDDASPTDDVRRITTAAGSRFRYVRNEKNLGVSGAFNAAMRLSESRYTLLVGPDDIIPPGGGVAYLRAIDRFSGCAAIHPAVSVIDHNGDPSKPLADRVKSLVSPRPGATAGQRLAVSLLLGDWTYNPAIAWRTDFVRTNPFDETLHTAMDLDLLLRLAFAGESIGVSDELGFQYRRHDEAVSSANRGAKRLGEELRIHSRAKLTADRLGWRRAVGTAELAATARMHGMLMLLASQGWSWRDRRSLARLALGPVSSA